MKIRYYAYTADTFEYFPQFNYVPLLHQQKTHNLALHHYCTGFMNYFLFTNALLLGMSYKCFLKAKAVIILSSGFQLKLNLPTFPANTTLTSLIAVTDALEIPTLLFTPPTEHYTVGPIAKAPAHYSHHTGIPPIVSQELRKLNLKPDDEILVFGKLSGWATKDFKNILDLLDGFAHANSYAK